MKLLLQIATLAAACTAGAQGTVEAVFDYSTATAGSLNGTVGWTFQLSTNVTVTDLGCFNYLFQGGVQAVSVGLWADDRTLLASNEVTSASTLFNQSRYSSITPVVLNPFQVYHLGAFATNGLNVQAFIPDLNPGDFVSVSPPITLLNTAQGTGGFVFPVQGTGTAGSIILAPNFLMLGAVPEPSTWALLCLGGLGLAGRLRTRTRRRRAGRR